MKNLVIELLLKLAKVDAKTKELVAQVDAQALMLAAMVLTLDNRGDAYLSSNIQKAICSAAAASTEIFQSDADLLLRHFLRLMTIAQFVEANDPAQTDIAG